MSICFSNRCQDQGTTNLVAETETKRGVSAERVPALKGMKTIFKSPWFDTGIVQTFNPLSLSILSNESTLTLGTVQQTAVWYTNAQQPSNVNILFAII